MKDSNVNDLKEAGITAVQVGATCIQFFHHTKLILDWNDDRIFSDTEVSDIMVYRNKLYYFVLRRYSENGTDTIVVEFYGSYTDALDDSSVKMDDSMEYTIEVTSLIDLVMDEMEADFARGDHECVRELLGFVPIENLKGYLPSMF